MKPALHILPWLIAAFAAAGVAHAEEDLRGYMLASSCAACHGTDGKSPDAIPTLYGKTADFIVKNLKEFKSGARSGTMMPRLAKGYSDEEIERIGAWFAAHSQAQ